MQRLAQIGHGQRFVRVALEHTVGAQAFGNRNDDQHPQIYREILPIARLA
ncbi:MAG: hypothetical protein ACFCVA_03470 [Gammaproteobacteria bacterium]